MADANPVEIDVNTDNLADFNLLLNGGAKLKEVTPVVDTDAPESDLEDDFEDEADTAEDADEQDVEEASTAEDPSDEEEDILKPKPKKKLSAKERIDEITAEKYAERRRADELERRLAELEQSLKQTPKPQEDKPTTRQSVRPILDVSAPNPEALYEDGSSVYPLGEFDPRYIADLTAYTYDQRDREAQARRQQEQQEAQQAKEMQERTTAWEQKLSTAEAAIPDLRPTIQTLDSEFRNLDPQYGIYLSQTIMDLDNGPEVLFYLANNVKEAREIVASGPQRATLALGRLEARIQAALAKKAAPVARTTAAPKPPVVSRGTGSGRSARADTDDLEEFEKLLYRK